MGRALLKSLEENEGVLDSEQVGRPKHMLMVKRLVDRVSGRVRLRAAGVGEHREEKRCGRSTRQGSDVGVVNGREE